MAQANIQDVLRALLKKGADGDFSPELLNQLGVAADGAENAVAEAVVYSAFPIDDAQLQGLKDKLEARFKRTLTLRAEVDESLIGGIRVAVGDDVLDASVKSKIDHLKQALTA